MKALKMLLLLVILSACMFAQDQPKVFLSSSDMHCSSFSGGCSGSSTTQASAETVSKFQKDCPTVKIVNTANESDYLVSLNKTRVNLFPLNQFSVVNRNDKNNFHSGSTGITGMGDMSKRACKTVMEDWKQKGGTRQAAKPVGTSGGASGAQTTAPLNNKPCNSFWNDASGRPICTSTLDDSGHIR